MGAPYYPSSALAIEKMLALAGVTSESVVFDLGCGAGDIVVAAAVGKHAKKAVGIEQNPRLCSMAARKTRHLKNASIVNANYDEVDLSEADVVTLYQSASENARLKPKLLDELSEGARVVSHDFGIPGWRPVELHSFKEGNHRQRVLVYVIGTDTPSTS